MNVKETLVNLYELGLAEAELVDGTEVRDLHVEPGTYPAACRGWLVAVVGGRQVRIPHRLPCQQCGGCE